MWTEGCVPPLRLKGEHLRFQDGFTVLDGGSKISFPHSAAIAFFLKSAFLHCCASELYPSAHPSTHPRIAIMGKRGSATAVIDVTTK
jgi:hypothetical protein